MKVSIFNPTYNQIPMNDIEAIGRSSNVYMFKTAIAIGNDAIEEASHYRLMIKHLI